MSDTEGIWLPSDSGVACLSQHPTTAPCYSQGLKARTNTMVEEVSIRGAKGKAKAKGGRGRGGGGEGDELAGEGVAADAEGGAALAEEANLADNNQEVSRLIQLAGIEVPEFSSLSRNIVIMVFRVECGDS